MIETLSSTLNPSADVFVPGKVCNSKDAMNYGVEMQEISALFRVNSKTKNTSKDQIKEIATQLLQDYLAQKRNSGETITMQDIEKIAKTVIFRSNCKIDASLPDTKQLKDVEADHEAIVDCAVKPFDLSVFLPPPPSLFLASLYGLHRPEQAVRPLLCLTLPPKNLRDNLWSITAKDLRLWNPYCDEPCPCPPMFGYCIPLNFFGNPFNLSCKCSKEGIHFSRYPEMPNGNDIILFDSKPDYNIDGELLEDHAEDEIGRKHSLEFYLEQLKTIVYGVCDLISDATTKESKTSLIDDNANGECYQNMLWDTDPSKFMYNDDILEDDNCHSLLEMDYIEENEGVSPEVSELIRRCLSSYHKIDNPKIYQVDEGTTASCCHPPCSIWCHSILKFERSDSISSSSSVSANISLLNDTTDFLLNACKGSIPSNEETYFDSHFHKRIFKRSFSANDCDLSFEERCKINYEVSHFSASARKDLAYRRRGPIVCFKSLKKGDMWNDNSRIVSCWFSDEVDTFSDTRWNGSYFDQDHVSMWSLFNGGDSLWKPLPDCSQQDQHSKFMPKRVRDLKRQTSLN